MQTHLLRRLLTAVAVTPMFALAGCEDLDRAANNAPARPTGTTVVAPAILAPDDSMPKHNSAASAPTNPASSPTPDPAPPTDSAPDAGATAATTPPPGEPMPQPGTEVRPPEGSDGAKGQGYGGGIITEPVRQYFNIQYRITFDQLKHQLDIWRALNNRFPKDFDEYKKEIMEPCGVPELPELRPNSKYVYDPKTGELMVETKTGQ